MDIQNEIKERCVAAIDNTYTENNADNLLQEASDKCVDILNEYEEADARKFLDSGFLKDYLPKKNKDFFFGR